MLLTRCFLSHQAVSVPRHLHLLIAKHSAPCTFRFAYFSRLTVCRDACLSGNRAAAHEDRLDKLRSLAKECGPYQDAGDSQQQAGYGMPLNRRYIRYPCKNKQKQDTAGWPATKAGKLPSQAKAFPNMDGCSVAGEAGRCAENLYVPLPASWPQEGHESCTKAGRARACTKRSHTASEGRAGHCRRITLRSC